jgi:hypothetical protein
MKALTLSEPACEAWITISAKREEGKRDALPSNAHATPAFMLLEITFPRTSRHWISTIVECDR